MMAVPYPGRWYTHFYFSVWITFPLKDFSLLKYTWTINGFTKLNNEIINKINYHSNFFTPDSKFLKISTAF